MQSVAASHWGHSHLNLTKIQSSATLVTFQALHGHTWLVAAPLHRTERNISSQKGPRDRSTLKDALLFRCLCTPWPPRPASPCSLCACLTPPDPCLECPPVRSTPCHLEVLLSQCSMCCPLMYDVSAHTEQSGGLLGVISSKDLAFAIFNNK